MISFVLFASWQLYVAAGFDVAIWPLLFFGAGFVVGEMRANHWWASWLGRVRQENPRFGAEPPKS